MKLLIDTDAGVDDAQALMLVLTAPDVQVEAITTITGNVHINNVNQNVLTILDVFNADIPVYAGTDRPLVSAWERLVHEIHGEDGMGDWPQRPPTQRQLQTEHAVNAIVRLVNEQPGELTLVTLGPLTNIALAVRIDPDLPKKVKGLVFMGGAIAARGNTDNVTAEFNIFCDPEAAFIALEAFPHSTMLSWETTLAHPIPMDTFSKLMLGPTASSKFLKGISTHTFDYCVQRGITGYLLPDPLAMAIVLNPAIIQQSADYHVTVELSGALTRGQTVIDYRGRGKHPNCTIVEKVDIEAVIAMFERAVQ
ncbi:MAG: nucleoside hydrolase [Anaerolineaceae bacterium]|nr:nucleoside hydrolase [Anaerolineaceae bacterium]